MPIDDSIIKLVDQWCEKEKQSILIKGNLVYNYDLSTVSDFEEVEEVENEGAIRAGDSSFSDINQLIANIVEDDGNVDDIENNIIEDNEALDDIIPLNEDVEDIRIREVSDDESAGHISKSGTESRLGTDDNTEYNENELHRGPVNERESSFMNSDDDDTDDFSSDSFHPDSRISFYDDEVGDPFNNVDDSLMGRLDDLEEEIRGDIAENVGMVGEEQGDSTDEDSSDVSVPIRPSRSCAGRGIDRLEMKFGGKTYAAQKSVQLLMKAGIAESEKYSNQSYMSRAVGVLLTQMSATEGIIKHGEKAIAVLVKEFKQLDTGPMEGKKVVEPVTYNSLTPKEKRGFGSHKLDKRKT